MTVVKLPTPQAICEFCGAAPHPSLSMCPRIYAITLGESETSEWTTYWFKPPKSELSDANGEDE